MAESRSADVSRRLLAGVTAMALIGAGLGFTTAAYADDDPTSVVIDFSADGYDPDAPNAPKDQNGWTAGAPGDWGIEAADNALRYSNSLYSGGAISYLFSPKTANAGEPDGGGEYNTFSGEFVLAPVDDEYQEGLNVQVAFDDGNADRNGGALNFRHVDGRLAVTAFWPTIDAERENWRNETVWFDDPTESHVVGYQVQYIPGAQDTLTVWIDGEEVFTVPTWETYSGTKYSTNSLLFRPASSTFTEDGIGYDDFTITPEEGEALAGKGFLFSDIAYEVWDTAITTVDPATLEVGGNRTGDLLQILPGEYTPISDAYELSAEWYRDGDRIDGADDLQYLIGGADLGAVLTAKIVVALPGYPTLTYDLEGSVEVEGVSTVSVTADRVDGTQAGGRWFEDQFDGDGGFFDHPRTPDSGVSGFTQWANGPWTPPAQIPNKIFRLDTIDPSYQQGTWSVTNDGFTLDVNTDDDTKGKLRFIAYVGQTGVESIDRHLGITLSKLLEFPLSWSQESTSGIAGPILNIFLTKEIEEGKWITTTVGTQAQGVNGVLDFNAIGKWNARTNVYSNGLFDGTLVSPYNHFANPNFTTSVLESNFGDFNVVGFGINLGADSDYAWTIQDINILGNIVHFADQSTFTAVAAPGIDGVVKVGNTVSATPPAYLPDLEDATISYFWQVGEGDPYEGDDFEIRAGAAGLPLTLTAVVSAPGYEDLAIEAEPVTVAKGTLVATDPGISGTVKVDQTVTRIAPTVDGEVEDVSISYQWRIADSSVSTATSYKLPASARGKSLVLRAVISAPGYDELTVNSAPKTVAAGTFTSTPVPKISGTKAVGKTLTATPAAWTPAASFTYQWYRGSSKIAGATGKTYLLKPADLGKSISVELTGTKTGYTTKSVKSAAGTVAAGAFKSPTPTISGTTKVGSTLTANAGTWAPTATLKYQWYRGSAAIAKATGKSYVLQPADLGKSITVKVTGSAAGYTSKTVASAAKKITAGTLTTAKPTITGTLKAGSTLTAKPGTWKAGTSTKVTFKYQWLVAGKAVSGATKATFKVPTSAKGKSVSVKVTGSATGYTSATVTSATKTIAK